MTFHKDQKSQKRAELQWEALNHWTKSGDGRYQGNEGTWSYRQTRPLWADLKSDFPMKDLSDLIMHSLQAVLAPVPASYAVVRLKQNSSYKWMAQLLVWEALSAYLLSWYSVHVFRTQTLMVYYWWRGECVNFVSQYLWRLPDREII